jgi:hypothetical protein
MIKRWGIAFVVAGLLTATLYPTGATALTEAIAMYRGAGYTEAEAFNDEPYAHHWFERRSPGRTHWSRPTVSGSRVAFILSLPVAARLPGQPDRLRTALALRTPPSVST